MRTHSLAIMFCMLLLTTCGSPSKPKNNPSASANSSGEANLEYLEDFFDFGTITQGEVVTHTFHFKNSGNAPLVVKDVIPSCGCTTSKLSSSILKPGEEGAVEVIFNSQGWAGLQYKSVTLRTNSSIMDKSVTIRANVVMP